jgi:GNAT superfamily N-acetyltransferase
MSVALDRRRRGVGRRILDALVAEARSRGLARLVLETTASWREVRSFYENAGLVCTHEAAGAFGPDAWYERLV